MKSKSKFVERPRDVGFVEGGTTRMAKPQAAGPVKPGITGKPQNVAPGKRAATGGPRTSGHTLSTPSKPGHTAPVTKGR